MKTIFRSIILLSFLTVCLLGCNNKKSLKTIPEKRFDRVEKRDSVLALIKEPAIPEKTISVTDFGAVGDSVTDCKPAFDRVFEKVTELGGAKVTVPPGTYLIDGPLHLVSNLCLDIKEGARLKFSAQPESFLPVVPTSWEGTFVYNYSPFVYAYRQKNISIVGKGCIDGNAGHTFAKWKEKQREDMSLSRDYNHGGTPVKERMFGKGHYLRPHLIQFFECKNVLVQDVTITNSPFWCLHFLKSENGTFRAINFIAKLVNNDGIDPEYSKNILIENINFDNGDDNVAIKAGRDTEGRKTAMPSENIVVRNCKFKGLHAIVMGSEMSAGVQNVFVENCSFGGYLKRGIYLKSNPDRGGFIRNIYINNVDFGEVEDFVFITSFYHGEGTAGLVTDIHDIYIEDVSCKKATHGGIIIQGYPEKPIKGIYLKNITVDDAKVPLSLVNTEAVTMSNVSIGGAVTAAPSAAK